MAALGRLRDEPLDQRVEDGEAEGSAVFDPCGAAPDDGGVLGMAGGVGRQQGSERGEKRGGPASGAGKRESGPGPP